MVTAWFLPGASLLALLIVDVCCLPVKKGFNPSLSQNTAGPEFGVHREPAVHVGSSSSSSGPALYGYGSLDSGAALQPNAGASIPSASNAARIVGFGGAPAVHVGSSSSSGPALYGHGSRHSGAALHPNLRDMNWAVAPPSTFSGGEGRSAPAHGAVSSGPANVSPAIFPPPPPAYQAGELAQVEEAFEHGDYERETEDQGLYPPPMPASAGQALAGPAFTSQPQPGPIMGPIYPGYYPHYDYMFLTGQYPPGTYTDLSMSNEQGIDSWEDAHYRRHYPEVVVVQSFEDPRPAVKHPVKVVPYGKGQQNQGKGYGY